MTKWSTYTIEEATTLQRSPEYLGIIYVLDYGDFIKVGTSRNPSKRIAEHARNVKNYAGAQIKQVLVTIPHHNFKENEVVVCKALRTFAGREETFNCPIVNAVDQLLLLTFEDDVEALLATREKAQNHALDFIMNMSGHVLDGRILAQAFCLTYHSMSRLINRYEPVLEKLSPVLRVEIPTAGTAKSKVVLLYQSQAELIVNLLKNTPHVLEFSTELVRRRYQTN